MRSRRSLAISVLRPSFRVLGTGNADQDRKPDRLELTIGARSTTPLAWRAPQAVLGPRPGGRARRCSRTAGIVMIVFRLPMSLLSILCSRHDTGDRKA